MNGIEFQTSGKYIFEIIDFTSTLTMNALSFPTLCPSLSILLGIILHVLI